MEINSLYSRLRILESRADRLKVISYLFDWHPKGSRANRLLHIVRLKITIIKRLLKM